MPIEAPITRASHRWLREVTLAFAEGERRRRHPPVLRAGHPGHPSCTLDLGAGPFDATLRTDLAAGLLVQTRFEARRRGDEESRPPWLWLTRQGGLDDDDLDAGWAGAALAACRELAMPCHFVVVVRHGWCDPVSGVRREWVRLRRRS